MPSPQELFFMVVIGAVTVATVVCSLAFYIYGTLAFRKYLSGK